MTHNFLARTHHVRSFKKLAILGSSAERHKVFVLFKFGKPGIFYCEGSKRGVTEWSKALKQQSYMGYVLCSAVHEIVYDHDDGAAKGKTSADEDVGKMERTDTTQQFGKYMEEKGVYDWWRVKMGFTGDGMIE